jgi:AraC family transcriptional regulator of arabinose operon
VEACEWLLDPWFLQGPRVAPDAFWMWIPDAHGEVLVGPEERSVPVRPGDHVFLPAGTRHVERFPMRRRWRMITVHFVARLLGGLDFLTLSGFPMLVPGRRAADPLARTAERLCEECHACAPGWQAAMRAGIEEALLHVLREHRDLFTAVPNPATARAHHRLLPVLQRMESRLHDSGLTVRELARAMNLSEVRFRKLFRQATGMQPVRYVQRRRVEVACRMLMESDRPVKEVASICGFRDVRFFHRAFRRWTGVTPSFCRARSAP